MLTYPEIDPLIFSIFGARVRWYGMMYVVGFLLAWWLARVRASKPDSLFTKDQVDDLIFYGMVGVIVGGRLGYTFFYGWTNFSEDPLSIFYIWKGGMSFHGGLIGVMFAMWLYARKLGLRWWVVNDFVAPLVPLGLGFGRIGNFINGELWGAPAPNVPWAMQVRCVGEYADRADLCQRKLGLAPDVAMTPPLHPTMLYESLLEGFVLFAILWWFSARSRPVMAVSALFLFFYGAFRFWVEFYRMPDTHIGYLFGDWFTMGHLLSSPMIIAGIVMLIMAYRGKNTKEALA